jgi:ketosteroid isomerase-like protein
VLGAEVIVEGRAIPQAASPPETPERATLAFIEAQNAGELDIAASFFTPDATAIRGREEIRAVLAQLIASSAKIRVDGQSMLTAGEMALSIQRWTMRSGGAEVPFVQTSNATVLLRRLECSWKLMILAPWGLGGGGRDRIVAAGLGPS